MDNNSRPINPGTVSFYTTIANTNPINIDIDRFLRAIKRAQFQKQISEIRAEKDKKKRNNLKVKLPAICPAACFNGIHSENNVRSLSGFVSIDIDNCQTINALKARLIDDPYLYSMFTSPSGDGLKIIFRAQYSFSNFLHTFLALEKYFMDTYQVNIDTKCKNINRLVFISSDSDLFIRKQSKIFTKTFVPIKRTYVPKYDTQGTNNQNLTECIIYKIEVLRMDITQDYGDWLKIAFALVAEFGINGISYFHRISRFYGEYDAHETEKQYRKCNQIGSRSITIKSLYSIALDYGISYKT